ncbi:DUF3267 domain-containing protein [Oceanobacillus manasiensis]|uniref:DUF3267 domain-containing protein n=1 Tax=Oceanobacillus manasiensis TaxID=586413 RepID=UPI0005A9E09F|nr:DUF3267 domain-containing protein [Oceanobacillus manasiensis]
MYSNYEKSKSLNWEEIKIPKIINIVTIGLIVISTLIVQYSVPLHELFDLIKQNPLLILAFPLTAFVYIVLHELTHGILMRYYSGVSPQYGFSGLFIFAKSEAVFNKYAYIIITLAPMIVLGVICSLLFFMISGAGVWFTLFVWIINLYASRGDLQAVTLLKGLPSTYSIKDDGDSVHIFKQTY